MVLDLETTKTTQAMEIESLKRRVKKLENKKRSRTHKLKRLYKVGPTARVESCDDNEDLGEDASKQRRISDIDVDEGITLVSTHDDAKMFDADKDLHGEDVFVSHEVPLNEVSVVDEVNVVNTATTTTTIIDDITLAKAPMEIKSAKPKADKVVIQEPEQEQAPTSSVSSQQPLHVKVQDKGKGKMVEPEPVKQLSKKDQLMLDEELTFKLQAKEEEERLVREKAQQIKEQKQQKKRRNKPPTQAQQRKIMCTYLKNMEGKKLKDLKNKSFDSIQKMFDKGFKRVNTFKPTSLELVEESSKKVKAEVMEGSSKRAGAELEQESSKKQKIDDDKETAKVMQLVKIIPDEEGVAIDDIPLAVKPLSIVDWKIHKEGKKSFYKIIRAD
nr:hypothetical protein [Tanacetum cinerariifolium]